MNYAEIKQHLKETALWVLILTLRVKNLLVLLQ